MAKKGVKKQVLKISEGLLSSLTDVVLVFVNYGYELIVDPRIAKSLPHALYKMDRRMEKINYFTIKRAIVNARQKGWIKKNLEVTQEGRKRLEGIFPEYSLPPKWYGKWYLVNFDIPERLRKRRDILRENLKILGFGKLQNSVWISPYNFLGDVQRITKEYFLIPYVILAISSKVGQIDSKELVEKIWEVSKIQNKYQKFIDEFENKKNASISEVYFKYHAILREDPRLPMELLSNDWKGKEAYQLYLKITKKIKNSKNNYKKE